MNSILDKDFGFRSVTDKFLKNHGFTKITWGSPKKVEYSNKRYSRKTKLTFDPCQYCWELFDDKYDDYYKGVIYYYPEEFDAYVTPFQGDWKGKNPKHPAGHVYIYIDNHDNWEHIMKIDYESDIEVAISILKRKIKSLNRKYGF